MMNLFLIIAILITNLFAIGLVYQILKKIPKRELLIFMASSVAIVYVLVSITYWISGWGIEESVHENAQNMIVYLFVPVNIIILIPYLAIQYRKAKDKKIKYLDFANKIAIEIVIFIIMLVVEGFYFHSIQSNIKSISDKKAENVIVNEQNTENKNSNFVSSNSVNTNSTSTNTMSSNVIDNTNI